MATEWTDPSLAHFEPDKSVSCCSSCRSKSKNQDSKSADDVADDKNVEASDPDNRSDGNSVRENAIAKTNSEKVQTYKKTGDGGHGPRVTRSKNLTGGDATDKRPHNTDDVAGGNQGCPSRPPKRKVGFEDCNYETSTGRGRGRPPKSVNHVKRKMRMDGLSEEGNSETSTGQGRGCPPKSVSHVKRKMDGPFVDKLSKDLSDEQSDHDKVVVAEDIGQPQKSLSPADENKIGPITTGKVNSKKPWKIKVEYGGRMVATDKGIDYKTVNGPAFIHGVDPETFTLFDLCHAILGKLSGSKPQRLMWYRTNHPDLPVAFTPIGDDGGVENMFLHASNSCEAHVVTTESSALEKNLIPSCVPLMASDILISWEKYERRIKNREDDLQMWGQKELNKKQRQGKAWYISFTSVPYPIMLEDDGRRGYDEGFFKDSYINKL